MGKITFITITFLFGCILPMQGAINTRLATYVQHPLWSSFISFSVGVTTLSSLLFILRIPAPAFSQLSQIPWYLWLGGVLGSIFITSVIYIVPHIGIANFLAAAIAGQLIGSIVIDHFGILNLPVQPLGIQRVIGALFLLIGVYIIQKS